MATETKTPDGLLLQDNLSGALADINVDDANWLTATSNNANSIVAVSFPTPSGNPTTGAGIQGFTVKYRVTANASSVTFNAYLRESGTRINGGTAIDTWSSASTTEVIRQITWDAALLGTADGSLVEVEIVATKSGGSPANRTAGEFQFIDWDVDYAVVGANYSIAGAQIVTVTSAATFDFTQNASIVGAQTIDVTPLSTLNYNIHKSFNGLQTITATPLATMVYAVPGVDYSMTGDLIVNVSVNSSMQFNQNHVIDGDVTASITPSSILDYTRNASINGDVITTITPSSALIFNNHPSISGDVTATASINAVMAYSSGDRIIGDVNIAITINSATDYTRNASIAGSQIITTTIAGQTAYSHHYSIAGVVPIAIDINANMNYTNQGASIVGSVTVTGLVDGAMAYSRHSTIAGAVVVDVIPSASMLYATMNGVIDINYSGFSSQTIDYSIMSVTPNINLVSLTSN